MADEIVEPKIEPVVERVVYRIKYTYEVYSVGNERHPVFELIVTESDPGKLSIKVMSILAQNVGKIESYLTRLKTMEVLE